MTISRFSQSTLALSKRSQQTTDALAGLIPLPYTPTIGTATDGGTGTTVSVAFTPNATVPPGTSYTALSSPGSITASGSASPITVSGLTSGTAYTFQVRASNATGNSAYSAASNSVTPVVPTAFESIATVTATGGETTLSFTSIPQTYKHLQIRSINRFAQSATGWTYYGMGFNSNTTGYAYHALWGNGSVSATEAAATQTSIFMYYSIKNAQTPTQTRSAAIIDIADYTSTTKNKTVRYMQGFDLNGSGYCVLGSGFWNNTAAITSINIKDINTGSSGFLAGTTFALYGIKG